MSTRWVDVKCGLNDQLRQGWKITPVEELLKLVEEYPHLTFEIQKCCNHSFIDDYDGVTRCRECKRPMGVTSFRD